MMGCYWKKMFNPPVAQLVEHAAVDEWKPQGLWFESGRAEIFFFSSSFYFFSFFSPPPLCHVSEGMAEVFSVPASSVFFHVSRLFLTALLHQFLLPSVCTRTSMLNEECSARVLASCRQLAIVSWPRLARYPWHPQQSPATGSAFEEPMDFFLCLFIQNIFALFNRGIFPTRSGSRPFLSGCFYKAELVLHRTYLRKPERKKRTSLPPLFTEKKNETHFLCCSNLPDVWAPSPPRKRKAGCAAMLNPTVYRWIGGCRPVQKKGSIPGLVWIELWIELWIGFDWTFNWIVYTRNRGRAHWKMTRTPPTTSRKK